MTVKNKTTAGGQSSVSTQQSYYTLEYSRGLCTKKFLKKECFEPGTKKAVMDGENGEDKGELI